MAHFGSKETLLIGLKGEKGDTGTAQVDLLFSGNWDSSTTKTISNYASYKYLIFSCTAPYTNSAAVFFDTTQQQAATSWLEIGVSPATVPVNNNIKGVGFRREGAVFSFAYAGFLNSSLAWQNRCYPDGLYYTDYYVTKIYGVT